MHLLGQIGICKVTSNLHLLIKCNGLKVQNSVTLKYSSNVSILKNDVITPRAAVECSVTCRLG